MSFESEPRGGFESSEVSGEGEAKVLRALAEAAARLEKDARETEASIIDRDPILDHLFFVLIETGPELDSTKKAHIRRIIALRLYGLRDLIDGASTDKRYYDILASTVENEILELNALLEGDQLTDPWEEALKELIELESNDSNE